VLTVDFDRFPVGPGDRVLVEDPGYPHAHDAVRALVEPALQAELAERGLG